MICAEKMGALFVRKLWRRIRERALILRGYLGIGSVAGIRDGGTEEKCLVKRRFPMLSFCRTKNCFPALTHKHKPGVERMSNLWINIRFGVRHLQIGPEGISFNVNPYAIENPPEKWCEVFQFFWYNS